MKRAKKKAGQKTLDHVVETLAIESGILKRYRSGRIIHIDKEGRKTDVQKDLHDRVHGKRLWRCFKVGGGGSVDFPDCTRTEAMALCAKTLGPIINTDDQHGFIFYRDGSASGGPVGSVMPQ